MVLSEVKEGVSAKSAFAPSFFITGKFVIVHWKTAFLSLRAKRSSLTAPKD